MLTFVPGPSVRHVLGTAPLFHVGMKEREAGSSLFTMALPSDKQRLDCTLFFSVMAGAFYILLNKSVPIARS